MPCLCRFDIIKFCVILIDCAVDHYKHSHKTFKNYSESNVGFTLMIIMLVGRIVR